MQTGPVIPCDLVIIGGGLAGLSLACWLERVACATQRALPSICILEPRAHYENDRTWCFWDLAQHPFEDDISQRWPRWQVSVGTQRVVQHGGQPSYAMLPADAVYRRARMTIQNNPQLHLHTETRVEQVTVHPDNVLVSASGRHWQARAVVDTRPPELTRMRQENGLWQLFTGFEIDCPEHGYELGTAHLMDFQTDTDAISFIYLLPLGANKLLVEWTVFQPERQRPAFEAELGAWLDRHVKRPYRVCRRETGALPMMEISNTLAPGRVVNAGIRGGWMRPSSSYHFAACQRGCESLAMQILQAHHTGQWLLRTPRLRHLALRWMDRVFLQALRRHPQQAPAWFIALFANTSAAQMARFMNDQPTFTDILAIVRALPPGPLLKAALR